MLDEAPLCFIADNRLLRYLPPHSEIKRTGALLLVVLENGQRIICPLDQPLSVLLELVRKATL